MEYRGVSDRAVNRQLMDACEPKLNATVRARDVLQKQIDERVALRRQEMLLADSFYRERKTRRLAGLKRNSR